MIINNCLNGWFLGSVVNKFLTIFMISLFTFTLSNAYADVIIWQVEANPAGYDSGNEWLTILNTGESVYLDGWYVKTTHGRTATQDIPYITLDKCQYYKVSFPSQAIDNKDEQIFLYDSSSARSVHKTVILKDTKNNDWIYENIQGSKCSDKYPASLSHSTNNHVENNFNSKSDKIQELEKEIKRLNSIIDNLRNQLKQILSILD